MPSSHAPAWRPGQPMTAYRSSPLAQPSNSFASSSRHPAQTERDEEPDRSNEEDDFSSDESDEDEDEEGEELTPAMDAAILRTLRLIKSGDRRVYEEGDLLKAQLAETSLQAQKLNLLNNSRSRTSSSKQKPFSLQEHQRLALLSSHQKFPSSAADDDDADNGAKQAAKVERWDPNAVYDEDGQKVDLPDTLIPLSHVEEERKLRQEVTRAFHLAGGEASGSGSGTTKSAKPLVKTEQEEDDEEEEEEDSFLIKSDSTRTNAELEAQRKQYREFLLAEGVSAGGALAGSSKDAEAELKRLLGLGETDQGRRSMINVDGVDGSNGGGGGGERGRAGHSGQRDAGAMGQVDEDDQDGSGSGEDGDVKDEGKKNKAKEKKVKVEKRKKRAKEADDEFLMNYILNRGWIEDDPSEDQPTTRHRKPYVEPIDFLSGEGGVDADFVVDGEKAKVEVEEARQQGEGTNKAHPWGTLDEEDEFDEKAEEFETAYNFRFEEPGAAEIPSHPRSIPTAVRRPDDARKLARAAKAERKALEKATREEETRKQKGAKRREIEKVLQGLGVGEEELETVLEELMDGDWDEAGWDRKMGELVERQMQDDDEDDGEEKPVWNDEDGGQEGYGEDIEFDEDLEEFGAEFPEGGEEMQVDEEDDDAPLNMDADFISFEPESKRAKKKKNKKKDKGKHKQEDQEEDAAEVDIIEREEGATIEGKKKKVKKVLEEYRKLDHEDMIGDLPTRFRYAKTAPTDFGLTPAEILLATDAELNAFLGMKYIAPYRSGGLGNAGSGKTRRLYDLKAELAMRRWGEEVEVDENGFGKKTFGDGKHDQGWGGKRKREGEGASGDGSGGPPKKRKGKKERSRAQAAGAAAPPA